VGAVDDAALLGPDRVEAGDVLVGLASSGLHANGYSLVRSAVLPGVDLDATPPGLDRPLADELLEPCAIYAPDVVALAKDGLLRAAAHVTGGGIVENLPRALPEGLGAALTRGSWREHPIFGVIREAAGVPDDDMFATFNMGVGIVLVVAPAQASEVVRRSAHEAFVIGAVTAEPGVRIV
jgi:phosphoribosylformylglycinamidine cyclo-ligase